MSFNIFIDKLKEEKSLLITLWINKVTVKSLHNKAAFKIAESEAIYQK